MKQQKLIRNGIWFCGMVALVCLWTMMPGRNVIFRNGKSEYVIYVAADASRTEQTAAEELQHYLQEIGSVKLPITSDSTIQGPKIVVGYNELARRLVGGQQVADDDQGFTYQTVGKDIVIFGGRERGTMYGVFSMLENELGVRWYTPECTVVPKRQEWKLNEMIRSERPALKYRYTNYWLTNGRQQWSAHNKENMKPKPSDGKYGKLVGYRGVHTLGSMVPVDMYFQTHPEYFALRDGKRTPHTQLCLSNPEVLKICIAYTQDIMRREPQFDVYSVSQNDNVLFCQCQTCQEIADKYGGQSGLLVWFVNQVADAVMEEFPNKYISTLAYQYTRKAPTGIAPRPNVAIRLCSIECCFAHPLSANCPANLQFVSDLKAWSAIAPHLFIWDYIVDYAQFIAPWPNFQVLGPNIETFAENNAIGVFEEAQYLSLGAEFEELRNWITLKLLWNPKQDFRTLAQDFIHGYYGQAATQIWTYFEKCLALVLPDTHFGIFIRENDPIYTDDFVNESTRLLTDALAAAENDEVRNRVERVQMQILYLRSMRRKAEAKTDGTWAEFCRLARKHKARPNEWTTLEDFIRNHEQE